MVRVASPVCLKVHDTQIMNDNTLALGGEPGEEAMIIHEELQPLRYEVYI